MPVRDVGRETERPDLRLQRDLAFGVAVHEEDAARIAGVARPPVSIPFEATIRYGRGARAIACDSLTLFVTVWFG